MKYKELKVEYELMQKRYKSLGEATTRLEQENENLIALVDKLEANRKQMLIASNVKEKIVNQEIERMNVQHNHDLEEIRLLKVKANGN